MNARLSTLLFLSAGTVPAIVYECSPPPATPLCQFPAKIDITFIGPAVATNYDPNPPGRSDLAFLNMWHHMWHRFAVTERLIGLRPDEKEVTIWPSVGGGSPKIGRSFFVHAERRGNKIYLAECGNTRPVEDASSDIEYLRVRLQNRFTPYISGSVLRQR